MTNRLKQSFTRIEEYQLHLEELVKDKNIDARLAALARMVKMMTGT